MRQKKGFTLIELLVVIAIIAMLLAILMPALNKVKKIAQRVVCGTNLKGLGTATIVYGNDYDDETPVQGGKLTVTWAESFNGWQNPNKNWQEVGGTSDITIGASLYLLVREADVSPKSFVCGGGDEEEYDGENTNPDNPDIVELWDFGSLAMDAESGPRNHVSYAYHMPYGSAGKKSIYAGFATNAAQFAMMADKNPWMDRKLIPTNGAVTADNYVDGTWKLKPWWDDTVSVQKFENMAANSQPHDREGQNVMFADGHTAFEKTSDVGLKNDNIYTPWVQANTSVELEIRQGDFNAMNGITVGTMTVQPKSSQDSLLFNDDQNNTGS